MGGGINLKLRPQRRCITVLGLHETDEGRENTIDTPTFNNKESSSGGRFGVLQGEVKGPNGVACFLLRVGCDSVSSGDPTMTFVIVIRHPVSGLLACRKCRGPSMFMKCRRGMDGAAMSDGSD